MRLDQAKAYCALLPGVMGFAYDKKSKKAESEEFGYGDEFEDGYGADFDGEADSPPVAATTTDSPGDEYRIQFMKNFAVSDLEGGNSGWTTYRLKDGDLDFCKVPICHALLHLTCFGEETVWKDGLHTQRSKERLTVVGNCLRMLFAEFEKVGVSDTKAAHETNALAAKLIKCILHATMGPCHELLDPREPYWDSILVVLGELSAKTKVVLDAEFQRVQLDEIPRFELKVSPHQIDKLLPQDMPERTWCQLRQDLLACRTVWQHPLWVTESDPEAALQDLQKKGIISKGRDAIYQFQQEVGGCSPGLTLSDSLIMKCDAYIRRWKCNKHQDAVKWHFTNLAKECGLNPEKCLHARSEAKGMRRLIAKTDETLEAILCNYKGLNEAARRQGAQVQELTRQMLRTAGDFTVDVNGVTLVAETQQELLNLFRQIARKDWDSDGFWLVRVQNNFHKSCPENRSGYRDLKVWVAVHAHQRSLGSVQDDINRVIAKMKTDEERQKVMAQVGCLGGDQRSAFPKGKRDFVDWLEYVDESEEAGEFEEEEGYMSNEEGRAQEVMDISKQRNRILQHAFPMLVEVQLHLKAFYDRKETLMHLPYEIFRGDFDYVHVKELRENK